MAGSLIKLQESTASGSSAITLTGITSTYKIYLVTYSNVSGSEDNKYLNMRSTVGGSADDSSTYDWAGRVAITSGSFANHYGTSQNHMRISDGTVGTGTAECGKGTIYIFNASNSSEFTTYSSECSSRNASGVLSGTTSAFVHKEAQATDGVSFFASSGNLATGTFNLYAIKN